MLDLETLIKETAADPELIEVNCCLEENNSHQIPRDYKTLAKKLTHRWGIVMVDDCIIIPKTLQYAALNALHFGHPGINKRCSDAAIFSGRICGPTSRRRQKPAQLVSMPVRC